MAARGAAAEAVETVVMIARVVATMAGGVQVMTANRKFLKLTS